MVRVTLSAFLFGSTAVAASLPRDAAAYPKAKAVYFMSNKVGGNSIHALPVNSQGLVSSGSVTPTGGLGSRAPATSLTDALNSQGSLQISGNMLFAVNAGSNTVSTLLIDETNPLNLTLLGKPVDSMGDFPNAIAVSDKLQTVCVANSGTRSGIACFKMTPQGMQPLDTKLRPLPLDPKQTTPPHGPLNTVSQIFFDYQLTGLLTTVKGNPAAKTPSTGYVGYFPITKDGLVSYDGVMSSPNGTEVLFGSVALPDNRVLATDASFGAALLAINPKTHEASTLYKYTIPNQAATCWAAQSPATGLVYTTDDGANQVGAFDPKTGHSVALTVLTNGNPNMIELVAVGDMLYALSHGNSTHPPHVIVMKTNGSSGKVTALQNFAPGSGNLRINVDGMTILQ